MQRRAFLCGAASAVVGCARAPRASLDEAGGDASAVRALLSAADLRESSIEVIRGRRAFPLPGDLRWLDDGSLGRGDPPVGATGSRRAFGPSVPPGQPLFRTAVAIEGGRVVALRLGASRLGDLGALGDLSALVALDVYGTLLTSLRTLPALPSLEHLSVMRADVTSLSGIERAPALRSVHVAGNRLRSLDALAALPGLTDLVAAQNPLEDFTFPASLRALSLEVTPLPSLAPLAPLARLVYLNAGYTPVTALAGIEPLAELAALNMHYARVSTLSAAVEAHRKLNYLGLVGNPFDWKDAENVARFKRMQQRVYIVIV